MRVLRELETNRTAPYPQKNIPKNFHENKNVMIDKKNYTVDGAPIMGCEYLREKKKGKNIFDVKTKFC